MVFDTSALLSLYLADRRAQQVALVLEQTANPVVTALARTELLLGLGLAMERSGPTAATGRSLRSQVAEDWLRFWVVPVAVDGRDGVRAAELGAAYGLNVTNALHLVALERLPRPCSLLTFDDRQVAAAVDLGVDIVEIDDAANRHATAHGLLADP